MEDSLYYIIINRIKDECGFNKDECNDLMWAFMIDIISLIVENNKKTIEFIKLPLYKKSPERVLKAFKIFKEECQKIDFFKALTEHEKE